MHDAVPNGHRPPITIEVPVQLERSHESISAFGAKVKILNENFESVESMTNCLKLINRNSIENYGIVSRIRH